MCALSLYILGNNDAAHHNVFHCQFKELLFVLLSLLTVSRYLEDLTLIITQAQLLRPRSGIFTDKRLRLLSCGLTLKLMVVIKERTISHWE